MAIYALFSPGGSPGVTTTALALALTWPSPVILAECDPAGGNILAGLFAGHLRAPQGLLGVALDASRGVAAITAGLSRHLAVLDESGERKFLAGLSDPRQAAGVASAWPLIAEALAAQPADVIVDCGRLDASAGQPGSMLSRARAVILVLRPSLRQIACARPRVEIISELAGNGRVGALLVGDRWHRPNEVARTLGLPVVATVPHDPRTAAALSDGEGRRVGLSGRPLLRAAAIAGQLITKFGLESAPDAAMTVKAAAP